MADGWMSPPNKLIWQAAFKRRATHVTLNNGDNFLLKYVTRKFYSSSPAEECVHVKAIRFDGPMGWFRLSEVCEEKWLYMQERMVTEKQTKTKVLMAELAANRTVPKG
jgi:hypothetical protein